MPFGAARASPDTCDALDYSVSFDHYGGFVSFKIHSLVVFFLYCLYSRLLLHSQQQHARYHYGDAHILCFSHVHTDGAGVGDLGNIGIMPTLGVTHATVTASGYRSLYSHDQEIAAPGYYAAYLDTPGIFAELASCGTMTTIHRYTYPAGTPFDKATPSVVVDLYHSVEYVGCDLFRPRSTLIRPQNSVRNATASYDPSSNMLTGWVLNAGGLTGNPLEIPLICVVCVALSYIE